MIFISEFSFPTLKYGPFFLDKFYLASLATVLHNYITKVLER